METARCAASWKGVTESDTGGASWKAVMECVMETARHVASWKGVMESDSGGASWKSRHGMGHGNREACSVMEKRHGNQHLLSVTESVMEKARHAASCKGIMQTDSCGATRNSRHGMRNGKHQRSQNVAHSECHGKVVMNSVMESNTCEASWKGVTEINICLA